MIRNYLIVAWRSLKKHKAFSAINVIGLSLSMSVCLLLILLIYDHYQYDSFHPEGNRTYRIISYQNESKGNLFESVYATSPLPFGIDLAENYAAIEKITNLNHSFRGEVRSEHKVFELERSLYADAQFFDVFGFELAEGDPFTALEEPFSIVLTYELAGKLFPNGSPVGQLVEFEDHGSYEVTGVMTPPPGKSHIAFDALASFSTIPILVEKEKFTKEYDKWENLWMNYNYLILNDGSQKQEVEKTLNELASANMKFEDENHPGYTFELQGITEVVPGKLMNNEISFSLPAIVLIFFGFLGVVVIITASINYTNLSIARSLSRTREIGIRKANGATKTQIITQFLIESLLISLISLLVAITIYWFLLDQFNEMWIFSMIGIHLEDTWFAYLFFLVFTLILGLITGFGPSYFVARMDTVKSLKGSLFTGSIHQKGLSKYFSEKKILLGIQFGLSIMMLITIFLLRDQANFLTQADYGFNEDEVFFMELQGHEPDLIASEFSSIPGVKNVSFTSHHPAVGRSHANGYRVHPDDEPLTLYHFGVDENYIEVMGLQLVAGSGFPKASGSENEKFVVLNELAIERLSYESPSAAIGQSIIMHNDERVQIVGVVKDYHWEPLMKVINPLALRVLPNDYEYAYFRMETNEPQELSKRFEAQWKTFDEAREYKGGFLNEEMNIFYQFMYDLGGILTFISLIAISITSLGFLGMVSFHLKTRVKEIGIRKVLGANFRQLAVTMTRGFLIMLLVTSLITIPLAVVLNGFWINAMARHSPIGIWNVGPAILIVLIICALTILSQVWKTSSDNPVDTLRSE